MLICPACKLELRSTYMVRKPIRNIDHPNQRCSGDGIGRLAEIDNTPQISKKQQQIMDNKAAQNRNDAHHHAQSAHAMNSYQTQHKNAGVQQARVNLASEARLGGHSSADSNSKQNSNTTGGLGAINRATRK
jgi:Zn-finger nucleic acid-binding protein